MKSTLEILSECTRLPILDLNRDSFIVQPKEALRAMEVYHSQFGQPLDVSNEDIEKEALILAKKHAKQSVGDFAVGFNWGAKYIKNKTI